LHQLSQDIGVANYFPAGAVTGCEFERIKGMATLGVTPAIPPASRMESGGVTTTVITITIQSFEGAQLSLEEIRANK
jgi:hypothetical protein